MNVMKLIFPPEIDKHNYNQDPQALREFNSLAGTVIDAERFPILALHWPGILASEGDARERITADISEIGGVI